MDGAPMDAVTPFAQMPETPEPVIAQVRRDLTRHHAIAAPFDEDDLDRVAETVVRELWESRVRTFVPVLALRQARELLRARSPVTVDPLPVAPVIPVARVRRVERDALNVRDDVLDIGDDILPRAY